MAKPGRSLLLVVLLSCAVGTGSSAGCGGADDAGDRIEIVDEGTGAENAEPLDFPTHPQRRTGTLGGVAVIDSLGPNGASYQLDQRKAPITFFTELVLGSGNGFSVDVRETYLDGVLRLPHPLVPEKVRVGRKWRVLRAGNLLYEYEIVAREVIATPHGVRPVWTIKQTNFVNGVVTLRRYAEGRGQLEVNDTSAVVLDDGALPREPALEASPLQEIPLGDKLRQIVVATASFVRAAGQSSGLLVLRGGRYCAGMPDGLCHETLCYRFDGKNATEITPSTRETTYLEGEVCKNHYSRWNAGAWEGTASERSTQEGSGAWVTKDGIRWIPRDPLGGRGERYPAAIYSDPTSGEVRILGRSGDGVSFVQAAPFQSTLSIDADTLPYTYSFDGDWAFLEAMIGRLGVEKGVPSSTPEPYSVVTLGAPGQQPHFALITKQKLLLHSKLVGSTTLTRPELVTTIGGQYAVSADENGQHLHVVSPTGRVDRVVVRDDALVREAIAKATLPKNQYLTHALDLSGTAAGDGRLLLLTYEPGDGETAYGNVRLFTAPARPGVAWDWTRGTGVVATQHGLDVLVCWPKTTAPLDPKGWSLGGVPALRVVPVTDDCAWIVRDVDKDPFLGGRDLAATLDPKTASNELQTGLAYDTVGPVPGVGRLALGVLHEEAFSGYTNAMTREVFAPLKDGGYVTRKRLWAEGGVPIGLPREAGNPPNVVPDVGGYGLWVLGKGRIVLVGTDSIVFEWPSSVPPDYVTNFVTVEGGGLLMRLSDGWYLASPRDRTMKKSTVPYAFQASAAWKDGSVCGDDASGMIVCYDASGTETLRVARPGDFWTMGARLADGSMIFDPPYEVPLKSPVRLDRATKAFVPYAMPGSGFQSVRYALDGTPWVVRKAGDADGRVTGKLGPTGFVAVDVSAWKKRAYAAAIGSGGKIDALVPGREVLWVSVGVSATAIPYPE